MLVIYAVLFLLAGYFLRKFLNKDGNPIPGPPGKPIVGNTFDFTGDTEHLQLSDWVKQYGHIFAISVYGKRQVVLNNERLLKKALSTSEFRNYFSCRPSSFYGYFIFYGDQGMSFLDDIPKHLALRKAFTKCLHKYGDGLQAFEDTITKESQRLVQKFRLFEGQDCEPTEELRCYLSNVMAVLLSGEIISTTGKSDDIMWEYTRGNNAIMNAKMFITSTRLPFLRFFPCKIREIYLRLTTYKKELVSKYFDNMRETYNPKRTRGLVDAMFSAQEEELRAGGDIVLTDEQICSVIVEIVAAGMNTSVATICSIIICLIHDQNIQDKVYTEILKVIGPDRHPNLSDRAHMPYLEAVIYESLRYAPPAPLAIPHLCSEDVQFEGYTIRKGDELLLNIWHVQHDEEIWGDPFVYRPERFLDVDGQMLPPSHKLRQNWIPFSLGRRHCVGESIARSRLFLLMATLFQTYRFLPPNNGECISSDPRTYDVGVVIHPKDFRCRIEPRSKIKLDQSAA